MNYPVMNTMKYPKSSLRASAVTLALAGCLSLPAMGANIPRSGRLVLERRTVNSVPVKLITVNLNSPEVRVTPMVAARGIGSTESLSAMMSRARASAGVTGTFFGLDTLQPIGDIVIAGQLAHFGGRGAALCLYPNKETGGTLAAMRPNAGLWRHTDWSNYDSVLAGGMWLVRNGSLALAPRAQGFRDPSLFKPNPRVAVGINRNNKLLLVATGKAITLGAWAKVLHRLGSEDALNLDGGSSTGMFYQGYSVIRPRRSLTNALLVYSRRDNYERALTLLSPNTMALAQ